MVHHLRQARGYAFETTVVKKLSLYEWEARRLGGSSMGLPDVVAVSTYLDTIYALECKSTKSTEAYVHQDQLLRCKDILRMFDRYTNRYVVLGFKFAANTFETKITISKITGKQRKKIVKARKLKYYFFLISNPYYFDNIEWFKCNDQGSIDVKSLVSLKQMVKPSKLYERVVTSIDGLRSASSQRSLV